MRAACKAYLISVIFYVAPLYAQASRDSAGVRIVENQAPARTAQLVLTRFPLFQIGAQRGAQYEFSSIRGVAKLTDGTIVVADGGSRELRFFNARGVYTKTAAGPGEGPGEFRTLSFFRKLAGDTLVGGGTGFLKFFAPDGTFIRQQQLGTINANGPPTGPRLVVGIFDDQSVLAVPLVRPRPGAGRIVDSIEVFYLPRSGGPPRNIGTFPQSIFEWRENIPTPLWFTPTAIFVTSGNSILFGFGNSYSIRTISISGRLERIVRRQWTPRPVTRADYDKYVDEWSKRWIRTTGAEAEREKEEMRRAPYADTVPAFADIIVDAAARIWVRETHLEDAPGSGSLDGRAIVPTVWSVFSAAGIWQGNVTMPVNFLPKEIGVDYVLGVSTGRDDVQTVVMYGLEVR